MKSLFNFISGSVLTGLIYLLGGWDIALKTLIIVIVIDYITGVCKAIVKKKLNSKIGLVGIIKKLGYFIAVALGCIIDYITGDTGAVRTVIIYSFVANDGISIVENLGKIGVPLPKVITEKLEQLRPEYKEGE